jgi:hypothetical protein
VPGRNAWPTNIAAVPIRKPHQFIISCQLMSSNNLSLHQTMSVALPNELEISNPMEAAETDPSPHRLSPCFCH